jgi:4-diphosphocytidyl-2-C-methyl-D-erythritol kinase
MGNEVQLFAPAKVNLCLHIGGREKDGYHRLVSLFQMVSLYDHIHIRSLKAKDAFRLEGKFDFPAEENIITRAVRLFRERTGARQGVEIRVRKEIPLGAGLAGGSSDAAAVMCGLNVLFSGGLDREGLSVLASELGSDIPFFLGAPAALVRGRGEMVEPLAPRRDFALVLVYPGFPVASRRAYEWLDAYRGAEAAEKARCQLPEPDTLRRMYGQEEIATWTLFNSFTPVLTARFPLLEEIKTTLKQAGAIAAGVSGSGSTVFGLFPGRDDARRAAGKIKKGPSQAKFVDPLEKSPFTGLE